MLSIILFSCKKKEDKPSIGIALNIDDCLNKPLPAEVQVKHQSGKREVLQYSGSTLNIYTDENTTLNLTIIANGDSLIINYPVGKSFNSLTPEFCSGLKFSFMSKLVGPGGTSLFGNLKTANNYTIKYNPANNSTYINAPIQQMSVNNTYPWQTGYVFLKIKGKTISDCFDATNMDVALSNDTAESYMAFGMYSTDSVGYQHKYFISNSTASLKINNNKQLSRQFLEISIASPQLPPGNFNVLNNIFGLGSGTDLLGCNIEVKRK